jgi:all-trans-retinol 13,14-reductase
MSLASRALSGPDGDPAVDGSLGRGIHVVNMGSSSESWDCIVIGSGIGGLVAAAVLARSKGLRVLVLERHYVAGGFTHEFRRKGGLRWDVGVHYVGDLAPGTPGRTLFDYASAGKLDWQPMAEPFERFVYPGFDFEVFGDPGRYRSDLCAAAGTRLAERVRSHVR